MSKGLSFDELYPGAYVKAGEFDGKPATLTIASVKREMLVDGAGGEEGAVILSFSKTDKKLVLNKTNGVCLRAMWGDDSGEWVGHRVTLHPVKDESGLSESGLCIRVKGSPELTKPLTFKARLGRKMVTQMLVPTGKKPAPVPVPENVDEVTGEVFGEVEEEAEEITTHPEDETDFWPEDEAEFVPDDEPPGMDAAAYKAQKAAAVPVKPKKEGLS